MSGNRRRKLICLHHAGGAPSVFDAWAGAAPDWLEVIALELPRSPENSNRRLYRSTEELVPVLARDVVGKTAGEPYVIFGQSMGGLLAYLIARHFHEHGGPLPEALAVAAYAAPHIPWRDPTDPDAPDEELIRRLHAIGGIPDWLANRPEWLSPFLGLVRDDAKLCGSYRHVPQSHRLPVPVHAFGGSRDVLVPKRSLQAWSEIAEDVTVNILDGGHFLVSEDFGQLRRLIFGLASDGRIYVG